MPVNPNKVIAARSYIYKEWGDLPIPEKSIIILMGHRSGSTLLSRHLSLIDYGDPVEAFHSNTRPLVRDKGWNIDLNDPFAYMVQVLQSETVNGVFAMKMSFNQLQNFQKIAELLMYGSDLELNEAELLSVFFRNPYYIYLVRRNKVKQAVSLSRALQDGIWNLPKDHSDEYKKYLMPAVFDREHIEGCLELSLANDIAWKDFLIRNELDYFSIEFETLIADYKNQLSALHEYLDVDNDIVIPDPPLQKISNKDSKDWEERFVAETPWIQDFYYQQAMQAGDLQAALNRRSYLLMSEKVDARWKAMPSNHYKSIRKFVFRVKRKLKEVLFRS